MTVDASRFSPGDRIAYPERMLDRDAGRKIRGAAARDAAGVAQNCRLERVLLEGRPHNEVNDV